MAESFTEGTNDQPADEVVGEQAEQDESDKGGEDGEDYEDAQAGKDDSEDKEDTGEDKCGVETDAGKREGRENNTRGEKGA